MNVSELNEVISLIDKLSLSSFHLTKLDDVVSVLQYDGITLASISKSKSGFSINYPLPSGVKCKKVAVEDTSVVDKAFFVKQAVDYYTNISAQVDCSPGGLELLGEYRFSDLRRKIGKAVASGATALTLDGRTVHMSTRKRYVFRNPRCSCCGMVATIATVERIKGHGHRPHINLYGTDKDGNRVLLTADHVIPKSRGGIDSVSNYQTMCFPCNADKGDKVVISVKYVITAIKQFIGFFIKL